MKADRCPGHRGLVRLHLLLVTVLVVGSPQIARAIDVVAAFEGLANSDNNVAVLPPDDNLGVGPNHIFEMVNSTGRISGKSGAAIQTVSLRTFFGVDAGFQSTDPKVLYDAISGRWFASYAEFSNAAQMASIILMVSTSSDPTGTFCRYRLGNPTSETFFVDQPILGVSDDKVVVAYNAFGFLSQLFRGSGYYVVNKTNVVACSSAPAVTRVAPNPALFSIHPVQSLSSTGSLYMVENDGPTVTLVRIDGVPGVSTVTANPTALTITPWNPPPQAPQGGSAVPLDTGDERVMSASWRNNSLVLAGNESCTPAGDATVRSCLRVIEIGTDTVSVRQDMTFGLAGEYYYFPALQIDSNGNVLVVFTASSAGEFAGVRFTGRLATDVPNTLQPSQLLRAGSAAQTEASGRMGDYNGAAVDPVAPFNVWVSGEYIRSAGSANWGTYIAEIRFDFLALSAAVLPGSRSVQVNAPATAFATILASGTGIATGCAIAPGVSVPAGFLYQTTDPTTNQLTGTPNTATSITAGGSQTFLIAFTPTAAFPSIDLPLSFSCANTPPAPMLLGVNSLLLSASTGPVPDVVALAATLNDDGIVNIPGAVGTGIFAVATVNVGAGGSITVSADTGAASLPINISLCQTNSSTGQCISPIGPSVATQMNAGATPTFGIFVAGTGIVPFDPANNRIFVRCKDGGGTTRGSTSVAIRTQ
jgi:hypothetical protein